MDRKEKEDKIRSLVIEMLEDSHKYMVDKIDTVLRSGCIAVDEWNENMILPKCITSAILKDESIQYEGRGTSFEKQVKKTIKNIMCFI